MYNRGGDDLIFIEGREGWEIEALDDGWYFSVYEYDAVKRTR